MTNAKPVLIIAGPTASGKSALAVDVAREFGGLIVNADSMQIYQELRIITAQPAEEETSKAPHRLFGVLPITEVCSAARWLRMAAAEIEGAHRDGLLPIVAGGAGLYLKALMEGLAPVPDVPADVRQNAKALLADIGGEAFRARLAELDPETARRLVPTDSQRLIRAYAVAQATGRSLADWRRQPTASPVNAHFGVIILLPPREELYASCDARLDAMLAAGALDEARALERRDLDPDLPAMKAVGLPELRSYLKDEITLEDAAKKAKTATRRYAKRQMTWLRHQVAGDAIFPAQYSESLRANIFPFIRQFLLTLPS